MFPHSLVDKAVSESGGTDAPISSRRQEAEEIVCEVAAVAYNHSGFSTEAGVVCV